MSSIDELRAAMRAAQPTGRSAYVEEGKHLLEVSTASCKQTSEEGVMRESWIIEFQVIESNNPTAKPGMTLAYIEVPKNKGWLGRFKACLIAIVGLDPALPLSAAQEETIGNLTVALRHEDTRKAMQLPENFLKGRRVVCEGSKGLSRAGGPVTNKKWSPAPAPVAAA